MRMSNKAHFIPRQNGVTFTCLHTINMFFGQETTQLKQTFGTDSYLPYMKIQQVLLKMLINSL